MTDDDRRNISIYVYVRHSDGVIVYDSRCDKYLSEEQQGQLHAIIENNIVLGPHTGEDEIDWPGVWKDFDAR